MKITKRQLKRIIREEKARLQEYGGRPYDPTRPGDFERARDNPTGDADRSASRVLGALHTAIDDLIRVLGNEEAYAELQGIVEDWD